jgi:hypothetical protein
MGKQVYTISNVVNQSGDTMKNNIPSEYKFRQYEEIRESGETNMFDVWAVCALSIDLTKSDCLDIMLHYDELAEKYLSNKQ